MIGKPIKEARTVKYLGLKYTYNLNWNLHVSEKLAKAKRRMMQLKTSTGVLWGPRPSLIHWMLKAMCQPILTYGALIWGNAKLSGATVSKLAKFNRILGVSIAPMHKNSPTAALEVILDLKPVDIAIKMEGLKAFIRLSNKPSFDHSRIVKNGHMDQWRKLIHEESIDILKEDSIPPQFNWRPPVSSVD